MSESQQQRGTQPGRRQRDEVESGAASSGQADVSPGQAETSQDQAEAPPDIARATQRQADAADVEAARASLLRVFCAIEIPPQVRARVLEHISTLRGGAKRARAAWSRAESLHLTTKFFGEIEEARQDALSRAMARAVTGLSAFELTVGGAGVFPPRGMPRVLWLGIGDASGKLSLLQRRLEDECAAEGFARERRSFHPHLTLARLRTPEGARLLAELHLRTDFEPATYIADELVLFRSRLGPGGSQYTALARHELKG
ncbi:MAG TPA: RNA 2',3'-cyclic phosphodiesterase [Pyrinomonadaceae bacterium]|jgi:2'-5' RNA ligase